MHARAKRDTQCIGRARVEPRLRADEDRHLPRAHDPRLPPTREERVVAVTRVAFRGLVGCDGRLRRTAFRQLREVRDLGEAVGERRAIQLLEARRLAPLRVVVVERPSPTVAPDRPQPRVAVQIRRVAPVGHLLRERPPNRKSSIFSFPHWKVQYPTNVHLASWGLP